MQGRPFPASPGAEWVSERSSLPEGGDVPAGREWEAKGIALSRVRVRWNGESLTSWRDAPGVLP